jgi:hypothetical protein
MAQMRRVPGGAKGILAKALQDLDKANVRVGWFESSKYPDANQTPVAYVAAINELGPHARPFMKPTADARDKEWSALMFQLSKRVVTGKMSVVDALTAIGLQVGGDIQKTISTISEPPLSLVTLVARKYKSEGRAITGATIGGIIEYINQVGEAEARAYVAGISEKPLNDTGYMLATTSFSVDMGDAEPVDPNAKG